MIAPSLLRSPDYPRDTYPPLHLSALDFSEGQQRWLRGEPALIRRAQEGDVFLNRDGKKVAVRAGDIAVLAPGSVHEHNPLGDIAVAYSKTLAAKRHILRALPEKELDTSIVEADAIPYPVQTLTLGSRRSVRLPHASASTYLERGDVIEFNKHFPPMFSITRAADVGTRYISAEQAQAISRAQNPSTQQR